MTKVYSRDKKGRFCSSSNPELKALSLFVNKDTKNIIGFAPSDIASKIDETMKAKSNAITLIPIVLPIVI